MVEMHGRYASLWPLTQEEEWGDAKMWIMQPKNKHKHWGIQCSWSWLLSWLTFLAKSWCVGQFLHKAICIIPVLSFSPKMLYSNFNSWNSLNPFQTLCTFCKQPLNIYLTLYIILRKECLLYMNEYEYSTGLCYFSKVGFFVFITATTAEVLRPVKMVLVTILALLLSWLYWGLHPFLLYNRSLGNICSSTQSHVCGKSWACGKVNEKANRNIVIWEWSVVQSGSYPCQCTPAIFSRLEHIKETAVMFPIGSLLLLLYQIHLQLSIINNHVHSTYK